MTRRRPPSRWLKTSVSGRGAARNSCPKKRMAVWISGCPIHDR